MSTGKQDIFKNGICEIRWHGRGGQGAVSSAKILAAAAYHAGYQGVTSAPSFGAERRGAPVTASTRLSTETIRVFSQPENPAIILVLDDSLVRTTNATAGIEPGGWVIINSPRPPQAFKTQDDFSVATADAFGAARAAGLVVSGVPMVNTPMLGAFARATALVSLEDIEQALQEAFPRKQAKVNFAAAQITYERTLF